MTNRFNLIYKKKPIGSNDLLVEETGENHQPVASHSQT